MNSKLKSLIKRAVPGRLLNFYRSRKYKAGTEDISEVKILPADSGSFAAGINLIGPFNDSTGLGQSVRLLERVFSETEIPYSLYNYSMSSSKAPDFDSFSDKLSEELPHLVNIWHVNAADFNTAYLRMKKSSFDGHYNIAYWLWELEDFPDEWTVYFNLLDEIWTPSEFISNAVRKKTNKPVYTVPYYVTASADIKKYGRDFFNLPGDKFLFLIMYDAMSVPERKNPDGAIRAYKEAFKEKREGAGLVIKAGSADSVEISRLKKLTEGIESVYFITERLEKIQVNSLIACCDVYVSLHRAEGFGLVLSEAMLNKVPVIATNWSANTEFMDKSSSCLVDFKLVPLEEDIFIYKKGNLWAEPDEKEASEYMRRLYEEPEYYKNIAAGGFTYVSDKLSLKRAKTLLEERYYSIIRA